MSPVHPTSSNPTAIQICNRNHKSINSLWIKTSLKFLLNVQFHSKKRHFTEVTHCTHCWLWPSNVVHHHWRIRRIRNRLVSQCTSNISKLPWAHLHHITIWPSITLFPNNQLQKDTESPDAADICVKDSGKTHRLVFSYLLEVATASPHEHHRIISVCVRSHGRHPVRAVVEQRNALNDPQSSERLVQNQAAEIITNLLGLRDKKNNEE